MIPPSLLISILLAGLLLITFEFHRPGLILPGCLGLFLLLYSAHALTLLPFSLHAVLLTLLGLFLLFAELRLSSSLVLPTLGTVALTLGLATLTPSTRPGLIAPQAILFAVLFTVLALHARRARENKRLLRRK